MGTLLDEFLHDALGIVTNAQLLIPSFLQIAVRRSSAQARIDRLHLGSHRPERTCLHCWNFQAGSRSYRAPWPIDCNFPFLGGPDKIWLAVPFDHFFSRRVANLNPIHSIGNDGACADNNERAE